MTYIKFRKMNGTIEEYSNYYSAYEKSNDKIMTLIAPIFSEGTSMTQSIKEFLNKNLKTFGTNRLDFELKGNEVIIENAYPVEGYDATYIISKQKLIKLIDDWFEIKKQNPDEIILSREGDEFTVTGINKEEKSSF